MTTYTPVEATGKLRVKIQAQPAQTKWEQAVMKEFLAQGMSLPNALRFGCRIAQDTKSAFSGIRQVLGLIPNPKSAPQFGATPEGIPYLTMGAIDPATDERYQIKWEGDSIPTKMVDIAIKHDQGKGTRAAEVVLDLSKARVSLVERKKTDRRVRHDRDPSGKPHPSKSLTYKRCAPLIEAVSA